MNITLIPDYIEEGWKSMSIYDTMLKTNLCKQYTKDRIVSRVPFARFSSFFPPRMRRARYAFRYVLRPLFTIGPSSDVYHITDQANSHLIRFLPYNKTIITCHDLIVPYWHSSHSIAIPPWKQALQRFRLSNLHHAAGIIAVSLATKRALQHQLSIPEEKIRVIYQGVDPAFTKPVRHSTIQRILPPSYLLYVGTNALYKNTPWIISFFAKALTINPSLYLVKVGDPWNTECRLLMKKYHVEHRIIDIPSLSTRNLAYVYQRAIALVHPSFIEGFGLTVTEATASGTPIILSDIPVFHELPLRKHAFINPTQPPLLTTYIARMLQTKNSLPPTKLPLTWEKTAQQTHEFYAQVTANAL